MPKKCLVHGVGINDADYVVQPTVNGKKVFCKVYLCWYNMIARCYGSSVQKKQPTYIGCTVCEEWLTFSNFKKWMEAQDWQGKHLDKDIICAGNKIYCPEFCCFLDPVVNTFVTDSGASRGDFLIGVSKTKDRPALRARCNNPITKIPEYLGYFKDELSAHKAWLARKHELACLIAESQDDERVSKALRLRYLPS
jgi:hypothetical protein